MSASGKNVHIVPLADLHIGDSQADMKAIQEMLNQILALDNVYCILGGDLMDSAIASSIGDTYAAKLQPMEGVPGESWSCSSRWPTRERFSACCRETTRTESTRRPVLI